MIREKLLAIQTELKAPKNQRNTFGGYNYRSCEDILEALKPLLKKHDCMLRISDEVEKIGERYYIKATAYLTDSGESDPGRTIANTAYAREEETQKGKDGSQITGTASSYARKYALNGLFLIDDTKDADTDEHHKQTEAPAKMATERQVELMVKIAKEAGKELDLDKARKMTMQEASDFIGKYKGVTR